MSVLICSHQSPLIQTEAMNRWIMMKYGERKMIADEQWCKKACLSTDNIEE
jgi:hypothetical protein